MSTGTYQVIAVLAALGALALLVFTVAFMAIVLTRLNATLTQLVQINRHMAAIRLPNLPLPPLDQEVILTDRHGGEPWRQFASGRWEVYRGGRWREAPWRTV